MKPIVKNILLSTITIILSVALVSVAIKAATDLTVPGGSLSSGTPVASMHTLEDIYHKLTNIALDSAHTLNPSAGPAGTMHTVEDIYNAANDANLVEGNIKDGVTLFGVEGNLVDANSIPSKTLSNSTTTVEYGVYQATTLDAVDADLTVTNIKSGVNLFGLIGTHEGAPNPLEWSTDIGSLNWSTAITTCADLVEGEHNDWRLPTISELLSGVAYDWIIEGDNEGDTFTNYTNYWSNNAYNTTLAWCSYWNVSVNGSAANKTNAKSVRCVR